MHAQIIALTHALILRQLLALVDHYTHPCVPTVYACEVLVAFIWCLCKKYESSKASLLIVNDRCLIMAIPECRPTRLSFFPLLGIDPEGVWRCILVFDTIYGLRKKVMAATLSYFL